MIKFIGDQSHGKKPKTYNSKFKFKVAFESYINGSVSEVARTYSVDPTQLSNWRKLLSKNGFLAFEGKTTKA